MNPQTTSERLLALLPDDGQRIPYGQLIYRARSELHLSAGCAAAVLHELCTDRRAAVETRDGWQWVRRVLVVVDFPLRTRPHFPAPRLVRRPRLQGPAPTPRLARRAA